MDEDLRIFNDLVADYLSGAQTRSDYDLLLNTIVYRTSMRGDEVRDMLQNHLAVVGKRAGLQSVSGLSGWTPGPGDATGDATGAAPGSVPTTRVPVTIPAGAPRPDDVTAAYDYGDPNKFSPLSIDEFLPGEEEGREKIPEDTFGEQAARRGALSNFIQRNYGDVGGAFRDFLTNPYQQQALQSRFELAGATRPEGRSLGFADFMQGIGDQPEQAPFRTSGANIGQLDMLARYLATPDSRAFNISDFQRSAIEDLRKQGGQEKQFNMLLNPALANLSPYARGGFRDSAQAGFDEWMGQNLDNPTAQYLPYARLHNFRL
jgi:hypothetical protein